MQAITVGPTQTQRMDMSNIKQQAAATIVTLVTLVMAGVVTNLEAALPRAIYGKVKAQTVSTSTQPGTAPGTTDVAARVEILRNSLSFFWVAGGAVLGAYVGVAIRKIAGLNNIAVHISVSLATSLAVAPYILRNYINGEPETCFICGFLLAVAAWVIWEVSLLLAERIKKSAKERGWIGVKNEIWGGTGTASSTISPSPTMNAPPPPKNDT